MSTKRDIPHFRIGLLLTEAGIVAPSQLDEAIQQGEQQGTPFLRVLVAHGFLQQHELQAVIRVQSLIWSGLLDVDRAIRALALVHAYGVSIDQGLADLGWVRPPGSMADTICSTVTMPVPSPIESPVQPPVAVAVAERLAPAVRICQYCGTTLPDESSWCQFCTGENRVSRSAADNRDTIRQRYDDHEESPVGAINPPRDPLLMSFLSGCIFPGIGQFLIGQRIKALCWIVIAGFLAYLTAGLSSLILFPVAALDVYLLADKLKNRKLIGTWEIF